MAKQVVSQEALRQALVNIGELFVRKDGTKVLSTNDFTNAYKALLDNLTQYTLPPATASALGGVIAGAGLAVAADGTLSLDTLNISDIVGLADAIAAKAAASDLTALANVVNDASTGLATKAAAADLTTLQNKVNDSATGLDAKAAAADVTTLSAKVNDASTGLDTKLSESTFTTYQGTVTTALGGKVDASTYATDKSSLESAIDAKVAQSAYDTKVGEIETSLGTKVAQSALFENGMIKSDLLPSFVDDVVEGYYDSTAGKFYAEAAKTTEISGETSKIYLDLISNCSYRFGGSAYVLITSADIEMMTASNVNTVFNEVFGSNIGEQTGD